MPMTTCLVVTSLGSEFDTYSYYQDCLNGFLNHPDLDVSVLDIQNLKTSLRAITVRSSYDAVIFLHATFNVMVDNARLPLLKNLLRRVRGKRAFFLNNEFRQLDVKCQMADYLGADAIISQLCDDDASLLYQQLWQRQILSMPYGVDLADFQPHTPFTDRPIHIGFRGDYYPSYVGHDDRDLLLDAFHDRVQDRPIHTDIQVGERFDRLGWVKFLNQCQCLIGHEAGASRIDHDDNIRNFINAQEKRLPQDNFRQLMLALRETGVFDAPPSGRIAAPRNFEALATKTAQILLPGRYNDVLQKDVHYIELQRDFSNVDEVIEKVQDTTYLETLADRAYEDAVQHHTYRHRIDTLLGQLL